MIFLIVILLVLSFILITPFKVRVEYLLYKEENRLKISIGPFKEFINVYDSSKPKTKKDTSDIKKTGEKEENNKKKVDFDLICDIIKEVGMLFEYFRKKLKITFLKLHFHIGLDDPAKTGIVVGHSWSALYNITAFLDRKFTLKKHSVQITPNFFKGVFETDLEADLSIRIVYILIFAIKLYKSGKNLKLI